MYEECPTNCTAGDGCCNKQIHNKEWKKVQITTAVDKGKGVVAMESIQKDDFVIEYVGVAHPTDSVTSLMHDSSGIWHINISWNYALKLSLMPDLKACKVH